MKRNFGVAVTIGFVRSQLRAVKKDWESRETTPWNRNAIETSANEIEMLICEQLGMTPDALDEFPRDKVLNPCIVEKFRKFMERFEEEKDYAISFILKNLEKAKTMGAIGTASIPFPQIEFNADVILGMICKEQLKLSDKDGMYGNEKLIEKLGSVIVSQDIAKEFERFMEEVGIDIEENPEAAA